jgi:hypothetical protein
MSTTVRNPLRFDYSAADISSNAEKLIADSKQFLDNLVAIPDDQKNFDNVVAAMSRFDGIHSAEESSLTFPSFVSALKVCLASCFRFLVLLSWECILTRSLSLALGCSRCFNGCSQGMWFGFHCCTVIIY